MAHKLREHQLEALVRARRQKALAVFWVMRLGKTLFTIRWLEAKKPKPGRILVVAPLSVLEGWEEELAREGLAYVVVTGPLKKQLLAVSDADLTGVRWHLTNYETLVKVQRRPLSPEGRRMKTPAIGNFLTELDWDAVVLDESARIKGPQAKITKVCIKYFRYVKYKAVLAGIPNPEGPLDYFCQFQFLYGSFLGAKSFWNFRSWYFERSYFDWTPKKGTLGKIKEEVNRLASVKTLRSVGYRIKRVPERRFVELPPEFKREYRDSLKNFLVAGEEVKYLVAVRVWLQRLAGGYPGVEGLESGHKTRELISLLDGELKGEQVVVFFRFNNEIRGVGEALKARGISCLQITGEDKRFGRAEKRREFQVGKARVALLQTRCVRYGTDFSAANTAIYYSNWEDYEIRGQSEERILSLSKTSSLLTIDLITHNTLDEDIYLGLREKGASAKYFNARLVERIRARAENTCGRPRG